MSRKNDKPEESAAAASAEAVEFVNVEVGFRCPACGRDQVPRIRRTRPAKQQREGDCTLCGAGLLITYRSDGSLQAVRRR
jgi:predicted RNA-binding Zn-ribbon protein involved in translation (DUF1610 family)